MSHAIATIIIPLLSWWAAAPAVQEDPASAAYLLAHAAAVADDDVAAQTVKRIGVSTHELDEAFASHLGLDPNSALVIVAVAPEMPAAAAGVQLHDVIVGIGQAEGANQPTLRQVVQDTPVGSPVRLSLLRAGHALSLDVPVAEVDLSSESVRLVYDMALAEARVLQEQAVLDLVHVREEAGAEGGSAREYAELQLEQAHEQLAVMLLQRQEQQRERQVLVDLRDGLVDERADRYELLRRTEEARRDSDLAHDEADRMRADMADVREDAERLKLEAELRRHELGVRGEALQYRELELLELRQRLDVEQRQLTELHPRLEHELQQRAVLEDELRLVHEQMQDMAHAREELERALHMNRRADDSQLEQRLGTIEGKLDAILAALRKGSDR